MTPRASGERATGRVGLDPIESASPHARVAALRRHVDHPRGERLSSQIEEQILACTALSAHYLIEITARERLDEMRIQVECRPGSAALRAPPLQLTSRAGSRGSLALA